jgi:hypothetical protein
VWPCLLPQLLSLLCCLLQEVSGGSQAISAKASDVDFPTYYKVPAPSEWDLGAILQHSAAVVPATAFRDLCMPHTPC